jgi:hypothetical protein
MQKPNDNDFSEVEGKKPKRHKKKKKLVKPESKPEKKEDDKPVLNEQEVNKKKMSNLQTPSSL